MKNEHDNTNPIVNIPILVKAVKEEVSKKNRTEKKRKGYWMKGKSGYYKM